ncbi:LEAF RUST 10 DISEASE-RESISTANCE LOCUS RECEPTOR-LIKE PROTEIN KINASE-like 1.1, partial [Phalaenopsis equestris]|uniref:LEAF RUST 10 DISEASE-RESISTANCE LOCUS RECEPTOR-LIKE PROTEIN KINASE-like 1.1 n=1 Tax=Phalaenopsis equestris TaxID=78828 RepID=UPI0009E44DFD
SVAANNHLKEFLIIGFSTAAGLSLAILCFLFYVLHICRKRRQSCSSLLKRITSFQPSSKADSELCFSIQSPIFTYEELYEATNGFDASGELGDGSFGAVYKGKLQDGRVVAVKRLYENKYGHLKHFMNEVKILSLLQHQNLVSLYGCTSRRSRELLLVYEFVPNGTVADHLHGRLAFQSFLPWKARLNIAIETAEALNYLHSIEPQIIHRDIKTSNILLDNSFHVKVADFGLSRFFPSNATHVSTAPQGTPGYIDPEYYQCCQLTDKSDVYSFGVVLMELVSSKPAVDFTQLRHEFSLADMAINKIQRQELEEIVDLRLGYQSDRSINRMIAQVAELAFQCLQSDGELRPSINEVLENLREIKNSGYNDTSLVDDRLLKGAPPCSPNSVTEVWMSRVTTPNTSV